MVSAKSRFALKLCDEIEVNARNWHIDNWPSEERGPEPKVERYPAIHRLVSLLRHNKVTAFLAQLYHTYIRPLARDATLFIAPAMVYKRQVCRFSDIEYLYDLLDNEDSRALLVKVLAYRIMGHKKVKLPRNTPEYRESLSSSTRSIKLTLIGVPTMGRAAIRSRDSLYSGVFLDWWGSLCFSATTVRV